MLGGMRATTVENLDTLLVIAEYHQDNRTLVVAVMNATTAVRLATSLGTVGLTKVAMANQATKVDAEEVCAPMTNATNAKAMVTVRSSAPRRYSHSSAGALIAMI